MIRKAAWAIAIVGLFSFPAMGQISDRRPGPDRLAAHCVRGIHRVTRFTKRHMAVRTRRCVREITELLANEHPDQAAEVAARCTESVNGVAERGASIVGSIAERCITRLMEMDDTERLIARVRGAAEEAIGMIRDAQQAAVSRIEAALNGG